MYIVIGMSILNVYIVIEISILLCTSDYACSRSFMCMFLNLLELRNNFKKYNSKQFNLGNSHHIIPCIFCTNLHCITDLTLLRWYHCKHEEKDNEVVKYAKFLLIEPVYVCFFYCMSTLFVYFDHKYIIWLSCCPLHCIIKVWIIADSYCEYWHCYYWGYHTIGDEQLKHTMMKIFCPCILVQPCGVYCLCQYF